MSSLQQIQEEFERRAVDVPDAAALTALRDHFLSRERGIISLEMKNLPSLPRDERPEFGKKLNELKARVEARLAQLADALHRRQTEERLAGDRVDITLPGFQYRLGKLHPLRLVWQEMQEIFVSMGFSVVTGPEIETEYYNFEAINMPEGHPARDAQDTLYIAAPYLLRTHTSPVQIHTMEQHKPPIRIVIPGKVYRRDPFDATHSPMFHQVEGLVVDERISLADLKGTLEYFFKQFFLPDTRVRFRPSYFPFVEPGAEVDISCIFCAGKGCRVCKSSGWIEILGCGMVHPRLFEMAGYEPDRYSGFAWGMGIDRIAILKYGIDDIRLFVENDLRFLDQFS